MKAAWCILLVMLAITGCSKSSEKPREKTVVEKAFDAGQDARKKAEALKAEQNKKTKEANEAAGQ